MGRSDAIWTWRRPDTRLPPHDIPDHAPTERQERTDETGAQAPDREQTDPRPDMPGRYPRHAISICSHRLLLSWLTRGTGKNGSDDQNTIRTRLPEYVTSFGVPSGINTILNARSMGTFVVPRGAPGSMVS